MKRIPWALIIIAIGLGGSCGDAPAPRSTSSKGSAPAAEARTTPPTGVTPDTRSLMAPKPAVNIVPARPAAAKPKVLPDGVFTGTLSGERLSGEITLVVRDGVLAVSRVEVLAKRRLELTLNSRSSADGNPLTLTGRKDGSFLEVLGEFLDSQRASGTFSGTVFRKRVSGRWYVVRR